MYINILVVSIIIFIMFLIISSKFLSRKSSPVRISLLFWSIGLLFGAVAAFSFYVFLISHSTIPFYIYYFFGGGLTPATLGLGSIYLLKKEKLKKIMFYSTIALAFILLILLFFSSISRSGLHQLILYFDGYKNNAAPNGSGVLKVGLWIIPLVILNTVGSIELIGVSLYYVYRAITKKMYNQRFFGILTIGLSSLALASASTVARLFVASLFWPSMLVGWLLFLIGVLLV